MRYGKNSAPDSSTACSRTQRSDRRAGIAVCIRAVPPFPKWQMPLPPPSRRGKIATALATAFLKRSKDDANETVGGMSGVPGGRIRSFWIHPVIVNRTGKSGQSGTGEMGIQEGLRSERTAPQRTGTGRLGITPAAKQQSASVLLFQACRALSRPPPPRPLPRSAQSLQPAGRGPSEAARATGGRANSNLCLVEEFGGYATRRLLHGCRPARTQRRLPKNRGIHENSTAPHRRSEFFRMLRQPGGVPGSFSENNFACP